MAIRDYEDYGESETGNWNAAKIYSRDNIAKLLVEVDELIKICHFGTIELGDEFAVSENVKIIARIKAIKRFRQVLRMIIGNTKGVLKKSEIPKFIEFKRNLEQIKHILPKLEDNVTRNGKIVRYEINEARYTSVLEILEEMHENMIEPLNLSNLIFNPKDEKDLKTMKNEAIRRMTEEA